MSGKSIKNYFIIGLLVFISCIQIVSGTSLFFYPEVIETNPGDTPGISLMMEGVGDGLSGYCANIHIDDPTISSILKITFPEWANLEEITIINSTTIQIKAADTQSQIKPGIGGLVLADLVLEANKVGYATIEITPLYVDNDKKGRYHPYTRTGSIVISGAGPVPPIPVIPMNS